MIEDELIKKTLEIAKTIAMVGVSSLKKEISTNIRRRSFKTSKKNCGKIKSYN